MLGKELTKLGFTVTVMSTGTLPSAERIADAVTAAADRDAVIIGTYNLAADNAQCRLVAALLAAGAVVVQIAMRNPYDIAHLPDVGAALATYSWTDVELRAAATAGESRFIRIVPAIPTRHPRSERACRSASYRYDGRGGWSVRSLPI